MSNNCRIFKANSKELNTFVNESHGIAIIKIENVGGGKVAVFYETKIGFNENGNDNRELLNG